MGSVLSGLAWALRPSCLSWVLSLLPCAGPVRPEMCYFRPCMGFAKNKKRMGKFRWVFSFFFVCSYTYFGLQKGLLRPYWNPGYASADRELPDRYSADFIGESLTCPCSQTVFFILPDSNFKIDLSRIKNIWIDPAWREEHDGVELILLA